MNCFRTVYTTKLHKYTHDSFNTPNYPLLAYESLRIFYIPSEKGQVIPCLHFNNCNYSKKKLIVYFHGIGKNLYSLQLEAAEISRSNEMNVIIVEYPGYGLYKSRGITTTKELKECSRAVISFLLSD